MTSDKVKCNIDEELPDGWVVSGVSPNTGMVMSSEPVEQALRGPQTWHDAMKHAADLCRDENRGARVPSCAELTVMYNNHVKIGKNEKAKLDFSSVLWSSSSAGVKWKKMYGTSSGSSFYNETPEAIAVAFEKSSGEVKEHSLHKGNAGCEDKHAIARCVRDEPCLTLKG